MTSHKKTNIFKPFSDKDPFQFECHAGVSCFTECCARLRLLLTPYDILRIKNRLNIFSDQFLEQYTETLFDYHARFPMVKLSMKKDEGHRCPFVTDKGCSIYEDRPESCRLYPIGRASALVDREAETREKYFIVSEAHCRGFKEKKQWTLQECYSDDIGAGNDPIGDDLPRQSLDHRECRFASWYRAHSASSLGSNTTQRNPCSTLLSIKSNIRRTETYFHSELEPPGAKVRAPQARIPCPGNERTGLIEAP